MDEMQRYLGLVRELFGKLVHRWCVGIDYPCARDEELASLALGGDVVALAVSSSGAVRRCTPLLSG